MESSKNSPSRFTGVLKANASHNLGVLGFSSGVLSACVVAASQSTLAYISNAIEAFRLSFWIGVRTLGYQRNALRDGGIGLPWSVVLLGVDREEAEDAVEVFRIKVWANC
jgi:hypothetical protein